MQTKYKRHQKVRLLASPDPEYIEYYDENRPPVTKGMSGKINILLPNGNYHVEIIDETTGKTIAYVPLAEEVLEAIDDAGIQTADDTKSGKGAEDWSEKTEGF